MVLSDQDLWNQINAVLTALAVPQGVQDLIVECVQRINVAKGQASQSVPVPQPAVTVQSTLAGSKVKVEVPEKFDGNAQNLSNFLFSVPTHSEVLGRLDTMEQVKLAITLLTGRALTQQRSVSQESWAIFGYCN